MPYLNAGQLQDWQLYASIYGIPPRREDIQWGILSALQYNANRAPNSPALPPAKFMHWLPDPLDEEISEEELRARILSALPPRLKD